MAADNLPSEFDVVILGTGLSESVIAAACSRVGQRVLHVDRRNYYAGNWASFTFNGLLSWIDEYKQGGQSPGDVKDWREKVEEGEEVLLLDSMDTSLSNVEVFCYAGEEPEDKGKEKVGASLTATEKEVPEPKEDNEDEVTVRDATPVDRADQQEQQVGDATSQEQNQAKAEEQPGSPIVCEEEKEKISYTKIVKEGRRFNIDLVSKLMYSRGLLVDLLIKSNVSRYAEFKNVSRVLTYHDGKIEQVPCSRADVFGSKQLTVVEKRMLMKFLTFCMDYEQHPEEYQEFKEFSFWDFLQTKKLTENLQHFILHSIAMVHPETRTEEGLRSTQHFLHSLGRYGNTPFLFPIYGFGEIPQCFCRMCAVFGGIYCLRHSIQCLVLDKESGRCKAVIDTCGQRISCSHFVVEDSYIGEEQRRGVQYRQISRAVLITDGSLLPPESEQQISLVNIPPLEPGQQAVQVIELCSSSMTCMPGTYLVHLTCPASSSACEDLAQVVSKLFTVPQRKGEADEAEDGRPHVLWALYFNMRDSSGVDGSAYSLPSNVYVCSGPDASLGSDFCIRLAETVFHQILPNEEFCPPAPNPEDIVYEGDAAPAEGAGFGESAGMGGDEAEGQHEVETDVTCSGGDQNPAEERATDSAAGQDVSPTATEE